MIGLIKYGARMDIADSDGRDALMYAILENDTRLVELILENIGKLKANLDGQDKTGKSAVHYVI